MLRRATYGEGLEMLRKQSSPRPDVATPRARPAVEAPIPKDARSLAGVLEKTAGGGRATSSSASNGELADQLDKVAFEMSASLTALEKFAAVVVLAEAQEEVLQQFNERGA